MTVGASFIAASPESAYAGVLANVLPFGGLAVFPDPSDLFTDTYEGSSLDTTRWQTAKTSTGTVTVASGRKVITPSTTANAYAGVSSNPTFAPRGVSFSVYAETMVVPVAWPNHLYGFWGIGTIQGSPTAAAPLVNAFGFAMDQNLGGLFFDVWSNGVRTVHSPILNAAGQSLYPTTGVEQAWAIFYRVDTFIVIMGNVGYTIPAAIPQVFQNPIIQALPITQFCINDATGASTSITLSTGTTVMGDYGKNAQQISDGTYPWQKQAVGSRGDAIVSLMDGNKTTYSCSTTGAAGVVGDTLTITGSATKTVRVTRISLSGVATALADIDVTLVKHSTADSGGTSSGVTLTPMDSANAAATATVLLYTVAPTPGTVVGTPLRSVKYGTVATTSAAAIQVWDFGNGPKQGVVLRGVAQQLALNFSAAPAGGSFDIDIELTEE